MQIYCKYSLLDSVMSIMAYQKEENAMRRKHRRQYDFEDETNFKTSYCLVQPKDIFPLTSCACLLTRCISKRKLILGLEYRSLVAVVRLMGFSNKRVTELLSRLRGGSHIN